MKANEFIFEAPQSDLKQTAAANRQLFKRDFLNRNPNVAATVDAVKSIGRAWQGLKGKAASRSALAQQAASFSDTWDQYAAQLQLPPNDLNAYKDALDDWLGKTLKVNLDRAELDRYVTSTRPGATDRYFSDYFLPQYAKQQQDRAAQQTTTVGGAQVPAGKRIVVIDPKSKGKYYKTAQGWTNEMGQPISKQTSVDYLEDLVTNDPVRYEPA